MTTKILILFLAGLMISLYFISFNENGISLAMWASKYELQVSQSIIKIVSWIVGLASCIFLFRGFQHTSNPLWGALMLFGVFAAGLLGYYHFFMIWIINFWSWVFAVWCAIFSTIIILSLGTNSGHHTSMQS
jgi:hypothetical protein